MLRILNVTSIEDYKNLSRYAKNLYEVLGNKTDNKTLITLNGIIIIVMK